MGVSITMTIAVGIPSADDEDDRGNGVEGAALRKGAELMQLPHKLLQMSDLILR